MCAYFLFYCIHFSYCVWPCRKKKGKDVDVVFVHDFRAPGDTLGMLRTNGIDVRSLPWPKELPPVGQFRSTAVVSTSISYCVSVFACVYVCVCACVCVCVCSGPLHLDLFSIPRCTSLETMQPNTSVISSSHTWPKDWGEEGTVEVQNHLISSLAPQCDLSVLDSPALVGRWQLQLNGFRLPTD